MTPNELFQNQSPEFVLTVIALQVLFMLAAVLTALDSQERGNTRTVSVLWFFGVAVFPPVVLVYLYFRSRRALVSEKQEPRQMERTCPYCKGRAGMDKRICPQCGRLL